MLSVKQFYEAYGVKAREFEHLEMGVYQVMARETKLYIMCMEHHQDPFMWLGHNLDGVVFYTRSGYLSVVIFCDSEDDETNEMIALTNRLIGIVQ